MRKANVFSELEAYQAGFDLQRTDADGELQETLHWIRTAEDRSYISPESSRDLRARAAMVGGKLGSIMNQHEKFCFGDRATETLKH